ncbi:MAG: MMPL family transporter [Myxococcales bacterium]
MPTSTPTCRRRNPVIVASKEVGNAFGSNKTAVVLIESKETFSPDVLKGVARLTKAYKDHAGVVSVISLTNIVDVKKTETGLEVTDLIPNEAVFDDPAKLAELRKYTLSKSTYANFLVSPDARYTALYISVAEDAAKDQVALGLRATTDQVWPEAGRPVKITFAGMPMLMTYLNHIVVRDMVVLVPLVIVLLVVILYLSFRAVRGVVLPMAAVLMATVVTFGVMGLTGAPLTLIAAIMPVVLISNGSAYGIHMLNFISLAYAKERDSAGAVRSALKLVTVPILNSAITTFIGFLSFVAGLLTIFEDFGIYTAVGITASLLFAVVFIPAVVVYLKPPKNAAQSESEDDTAAASFLNRPLMALAEALHSHQKLALVGVVVLTAALVPGILRVKSDFDILDFFSRESEPRQADAVMTREFGGTSAYQIHVKGPIKDPLVMGEMYRIHKHLRQGIHSSLVNSIADIIADMNDSLNGVRAVPATKGGIESLYLLMDGKSQLKQLVTNAADQALIAGRLPETGSAATKERVAIVDQLIEKKLRTKLVALPFDAVVDPAKKAELAALVADELIDDLGADLGYAGRTMTATALPPAPSQTAGGGSLGVPLRPLLVAAVGHPSDPAALSVEDRRKVIATYLGAEDSDLAVDDAALKDRLAEAVAALPAPSADAVEKQIAETAPALASDAEGVKLAAKAMSRLLGEEAARRDQERLIQAVLDGSAPKGEPTAMLLSELRGELGRLSAGYWPVTPEKYASLTGKQPDPAAVVSLSATQAGQPMVSTTIMDRVVDSQIYSLVLCLLLVLGVMVVQLRSLRGGVIALAPIVFTLVLNFGLMGYVGITLNIVTALIASLAIGIGIDYTIHTSYRVKVEAAAGGTQREVLERVFKSTGRAVLINALAVMAGFLVIVASEISAIRVFGWLSALSIGVAAIAALTLYPILVMTLDPKYMTPPNPTPATPAPASQPLPSQGGTP